MTSIRFIAAALCGALLAGAAPAPVSAGGILLSATTVARFDAGQVAGYLDGHDLDSSKVRFGVDASRIVYRTVDPAGRPTTASALVVLPRRAQRTLPQATWLHGTTAYRGSVASVADGSDRAAALLFASAGFLTTAPDYLGLGVGPGFHPYAHAASTVTASVDALRAAREFAARHGHDPAPRVFVTGHSQGGHATMALGRALQRGADPRLRLGGLAPIAAPLRPSTLIADAVDGEIANGVAYLAYWTVAWNRIHGWYGAPAEAFRDPSVEALFDGDHRNEDIFPRLPATVADLFTPAQLDRVRHPSGAIRAALAEADAFCDWRPRVPVTLYASGGDRDVPIANSAGCRDRLRGHGARAALVDLGAGVDHGMAPELALPRILTDFLHS
ncbi:lipase family protein [Actinoplanes sp. NPDC023714]|uniref:alpha/beta hydrolase family protein n=1 Tax=Actinoplanes sp. NPDC023714 TaxID=3154322 RepID=UPI0033C4C1EC